MDDANPLRASLGGSRRWSRHVAPGAAVTTGPERRCRETAEALGLVPAPETALADWNLGTWAGRTLDELLADDPASVQSWLTDPSFRPPGGETLNEFLTRVAGWLDGTSSPVVLVVSPGVTRAALTHALQAPPTTFWRLDPLPLSTAELTGAPPRWSLRLD